MKRTLSLSVMLFLFCVTICLPQAAAADEAASRTVAVQCFAPATNYSIAIESVWLVGDEVWVVSKITRHGDIGGDAITKLSDEVQVAANEDLAVKHFIAGKAWNWWKGTECVFIDSREALLKKMKKDGRKIKRVLHGEDPARE